MCLNLTLFYHVVVSVIKKHVPVTKYTKTHGSESSGEGGSTSKPSEYFTRKNLVKIINAIVGYPYVNAIVLYYLGW